jgi:hypothetical protein
MAKAKPAPTEAEPIDPEAYYRVEVATAVTFERARLGPQAVNELKGEALQRLLASEHADQVAEYRKA